MIKILKRADGIEMTSTEKKHVQIAYEYVTNHNLNSCKINRKTFYFDFASDRVSIATAGDPHIFNFNFCQE